MRVAEIFQHRNVKNMQTWENLLVFTSSRQTLVLSKQCVHRITCVLRESSGNFKMTVLFFVGLFLVWGLWLRPSLASLSLLEQPWFSKPSGDWLTFLLTATPIGPKL